MSAGEPGCGEQRVAAIRVRVGTAVQAALLFNAGYHRGDKDEQRRPHREGVVLLVRGDGEEEQRPGGEEGEQPNRAHAELEAQDEGADVFADGVVEVEERVSRSVAALP